MMVDVSLFAASLTDIDTLVGLMEEYYAYEALLTKRSAGCG
jgi:hypothetical protein